MIAAAPTVVRAHTLAAALTALADPAPPRLLAGGTDLMVELQTGRSAPLRVLDLSRVAALRAIQREPRGLLLGALATLTDLLADGHPESRLLRLVAARFAAVQIRNRATIGGNLATASPAGDLAPALLALDAEVRLRSLRGARAVPLAAFFTGYRRCALAADELIEAVFVPARPDGERCGFVKVGTRQAQAIAKLSLAFTVVVQDQTITALRAAAGAVADRTVPLPSLQALVGHRPDPQRIAAASAAAARVDIAPIDDVRSTARYRRAVLARVLAAELGAVLRGVR